MYMLYIRCKICTVICTDTESCTHTNIYNKKQELLHYFVEYSQNEFLRIHCILEYNIK